MNVLQITNCFPYENDPDYGVFVKRQIDSLEGKGVAQDVIFLNAREYGLRTYFKIWKYDLSRYDVIHCHHLFSFMSVFVLAFLKRKPVVLSLLNEFGNEIKIGLPKSMLAWVCRTISCMASVCIYKASLPEERPNNLVYLPNGVDMNYFSGAESVEVRGIKKVLFVSSKNPNRRQKRIWLFKDVIAELNKRDDIRVEGVVASGIGPDEYLLLLQECDMHLLCSEYEGSPNSVKEAMSCNVPVVSTDVGNVKEMFGQSDYYIVSKEAGVQELANLCLKVLALPRRNAHGRELLIRAGLDLNSVADRLVEIYRDAAK